tara:strand:+ start:3168 stop:3458 length:291 start_codon:yes stop_codon:yes gene_type:complete
MARYRTGNLVFVAGEMISFQSMGGRNESHLFADAQLGLVVSSEKGYLLVWFPEFGTEKKENVIIYVPLDAPTTKIWSADSAMTAPGAKSFWDDIVP